MQNRAGFALQDLDAKFLYTATPEIQCRRACLYSPCTWLHGPNWTAFVHKPHITRPLLQPDGPLLSSLSFLGSRNEYFLSVELVKLSGSLSRYSTCFLGRVPWAASWGGGGSGDVLRGAGTNLVYTVRAVFQGLALAAEKLRPGSILRTVTWISKCSFFLASQISWVQFGSRSKPY